MSSNAAAIVKNNIQTRKKKKKKTNGRLYRFYHYSPVMSWHKEPETVLVFFFFLFRLVPYKNFRFIFMRVYTFGNFIRSFPRSGVGTRKYYNNAPADGLYGETIMFVEENSVDNVRSPRIMDR